MRQNFRRVRKLVCKSDGEGHEFFRFAASIAEHHSLVARAETVFYVGAFLDKLCDRISDACVDEILKSDPLARCAIECCAAYDRLLIMGEVTTNAEIDYF